MYDKIFTEDTVADRIKLEEVHEFEVDNTISHLKNGEYLLILDFPKMTLEEIKTIKELYELPKAIKIQSEYISSKKYDIANVTVREMKVNYDLTLQLTCVSDTAFSLYDIGN